MARTPKPRKNLTGTLNPCFGCSGEGETPEPSAPKPQRLALRKKGRGLINEEKAKDQGPPEHLGFRGLEFRV